MIARVVYISHRSQENHTESVPHFSHRSFERRLHLVLPSAPDHRARGFIILAALRAGKLSGIVCCGGHYILGPFCGCFSLRSYEDGLAELSGSPCGDPSSRHSVLEQHYSGLTNFRALKRLPGVRGFYGPHPRNCERRVENSCGFGLLRLAINPGLTFWHLSNNVISEIEQVQFTPYSSTLSQRLLQRVLVDSIKGYRKKTSVSQERRLSDPDALWTWNPPRILSPSALCGKQTASSTREVSMQGSEFSIAWPEGGNETVLLPCCCLRRKSERRSLVFSS